MKTFVLIAGMWLNADHIVSLEDVYVEGNLMRTQKEYCSVTMINTGRFTVEGESCADIVRDVTVQLEDPN